MMKVFHTEVQSYIFHMSTKSLKIAPLAVESSRKAIISTIKVFEGLKDKESHLFENIKKQY